MSPNLARELVRKSFHLLSLVYLAGYWRLGRPAIFYALGLFVIVEGLVELLRLKVPKVNRFLIGFFGSIHRPSEENKISGIFWTAAGAWLTFWFFGPYPKIVSAALLYLSVGDAAAALIGMSLGRLRIPFLKEKKTVEGSAGCFFACAICGWAVGLPAAAAIGGALAAAVLELAPLPLNDNLWLPLGSALILYLQ